MSFTSIETANRMAAVEKKRKEGGDVMGALTLQDYFAAKAMQAIFTGAVIEAITLDQDLDCDKAAKTAYTMANAMLKARES